MGRRGRQLRRGIRRDRGSIRRKELPPGWLDKSRNAQVPLRTVAEDIQPVCKSPRKIGALPFVRPTPRLIEIQPFNHKVRRDPGSQGETTRNPEIDGMHQKATTRDDKAGPTRLGSHRTQGTGGLAGVRIGSRALHAPIDGGDQVTKPLIESRPVRGSESGTKFEAMDPECSVVRRYMSSRLKMPSCRPICS